jgi:hypothetical protein
MGTSRTPAVEQKWSAAFLVAATLVVNTQQAEYTVIAYPVGSRGSVCWPGGDVHCYTSLFNLLVNATCDMWAHEQQLSVRVPPWKWHTQSSTNNS